MRRYLERTESVTVAFRMGLHALQLSVTVTLGHFGFFKCHVNVLTETEQNL